jgi:uncharacterized GH25 family protein
VIAMRIACILVFLLVTPVSAHDLWLIPPEAPVSGKPAVVRVNSGDRFPESEHAPDPANFARLRLINPDGNDGQLKPCGTKELSGLTSFTPETPGIYRIGVETKPKLIQLNADKFNEYLVSDGLPHIYRLRFAEKTLDQPAKERYSKSPKALVRVGDGKGDPCREMGLPLEIVPLRDPFSRKVGDTLPIRVLFRGKPLAEANLGWDRPGRGERPRGTVRTDDKGEASIPIVQTGLMTIRLTHMTRPKNVDYEWESFWTSLTFRLPE